MIAMRQRVPKAEKGKGVLFAAPPFADSPHQAVSSAGRKTRHRFAMKQDKTAKLETEAMRLLRAILLELDFDEAEGHPPGDTLSELRSQARRLIEAEKRHL